MLAIFANIFLVATYAAMAVEYAMIAVAIFLAKTTSGKIAAYLLSSTCAGFSLLVVAALNHLSDSEMGLWFYIPGAGLAVPLLHALVHLANKLDAARAARLK